MEASLMQVYTVKSAQILYVLCACALINQYAHATNIIQAGVHITEFGLKLPQLVRTGTELGSIAEGVAPIMNAATSAFSDKNIQVFLKVATAYNEKKYTELGLTQLGETLNSLVPTILAALLASYPFVRLGIERFVYPIANLTYSVADVIGFSLAKNYARDIKTPIESGILQETFELLNEIDDLYADLLPRITLLLAELDVLIPEAMNMGVLALD